MISVKESRARSVGVRTAADLRLQLGGQPLLFLIADVALLLGSIFQLLVGGGTPEVVYTAAGVVPLVLLGPAACSTAFAVEKKAGNLELTISLPHPWRLFFRRAGVIVALLEVQGALLIVCSWVFEGFSYPILPVLLQLTALAGLVAALSLAWAATASSPPVAFACSVGSLYLLAPWTFFVPIRTSYDRLPRAVLPALERWPELSATLGFVLLLTALATAYVRRRLIDPLSLTR